MAQYLDIRRWKRKEQFLFFKNYENPFFNICSEVDVSSLRAFVKSEGLSFFIAVLYLSMKSANLIEEFRYRIRDEGVLVHDVIHAGSAVLNKDETFSFCYFDYSTEFSRFCKEAAEKLARHAEGYKSLEPQEHRDDLIHYSVIPWISFSSFSHARNAKSNDSIPKIVFGRYHEVNGKMRMPVSVEVHHALMDGIHVGKFFEQFQQALLNPADMLAL